MLSSASEKIAADPVRKYAMNLMVSSAIPTPSDNSAAVASLVGTRPSPGIMPYSTLKARSAAQQPPPAHSSSSPPPASTSAQHRKTPAATPQTSLSRRPAVTQRP